MLSTQLSYSKEANCGLYSFKFYKCSTKVPCVGYSVFTKFTTSSGVSKGKSLM